MWKIFLLIFRAASGRPDLSCVWKLLGDACTLLSPIPEDALQISVPEKLLSATKSKEESLKKINKKELLSLGTRYRILR